MHNEKMDRRILGSGRCRRRSLVFAEGHPVPEQLPGGFHLRGLILSKDFSANLLAFSSFSLYPTAAAAKAAAARRPFVMQILPQNARWISPKKKGQTISAGCVGLLVKTKRGFFLPRILPALSGNRGKERIIRMENGNDFPSAFGHSGSSASPCGAGSP